MFPHTAQSRTECCSHPLQDLLCHKGLWRAGRETSQVMKHRKQALLSSVVGSVCLYGEQHVGIWTVRLIQRIWLHININTWMPPFSRMLTSAHRRRALPDITALLPREFMRQRYFLNMGLVCRMGIFICTLQFCVEPVWSLPCVVRERVLLDKSLLWMTNVCRMQLSPSAHFHTHTVCRLGQRLATSTI